MYKEICEEESTKNNTYTYVFFVDGDRLRIRADTYRTSDNWALFYNEEDELIMEIPGIQIKAVVLDIDAVEEIKHGDG